MIFACADCTIGITLPDSLRDDPILSNLGNVDKRAEKHTQLVISEEAKGTFALTRGRFKPETNLKRGALLRRVLQILQDSFEAATSNTISASAVAFKNSAAVFVGIGKSSIAAWLIEKGLQYVADETVSLGSTLQGLSTPLHLDANAAVHLAQLSDFGSAPMVKLADRFFIAPKQKWQPEENLKCGILIFLNHITDAEFKIEKIGALDAALLLKKNQKHRREEYVGLLPLTETTPTIKLTYGSFDQLEDVLDNLLMITLGRNLSPLAFDRFISAMPQFASPPKKIFEIPDRSDRKITCKLTIGMATFDDYDGVYFSIQAIRLFHPEILQDVEFVIIDNNPAGPCAAELKKLEGPIPNLRYIPAGDVVGSTIKDRVFTEANGTYVLCMDCHVMFVPGSLKKLLDYFETNPNTNDLLQGPLVYDDLKSLSTSWNTEKWSSGMLGKWHTDEQGLVATNPPFEIEAQGMGAFACRKVAWPGFNKSFKGFGGEEVYIHGKFRQRGDKALCLPFLVWLHRFGRPMGAPYPNNWEDRIRNALIGFNELGWNTNAMVEHFQELLRKEVADQIVTDVCAEFGWSIESHLKFTPPKQPEILPPKKRQKPLPEGISVIMPAYNSAKYIAFTIESVLAQTHKNLELIIVNDGSTDETQSIIEKFMRLDKRIKLINQKNQGEPAAVNAAIKATKFDFIARIDSDDVMLPERLDLQIRYLIDHPEISILGSAMQMIDANGLKGKTLDYALTAEACHAVLQSGNVGPVGNPSAMFRRTVFKKLRGYRKQFKQSSSDFDLWLRADEHFKMANLPQALTQYRWHGENLSSTKRLELTVGANIARIACEARKRKERDPIGAESEISLATLDKFTRTSMNRAIIFRELLDLANNSYRTTRNQDYLKAVDYCLEVVAKSEWGRFSK
jgi:glycosyltransferase involved in cell wall biosynthesis